MEQAGAEGISADKERIREAQGEEVAVSDAYECGRHAETDGKGVEGVCGEGKAYDADEICQGGVFTSCGTFAVLQVGAVEEAGGI